MKSLFKLIEKNGNRIEAIQENIQCVKTMPFYSIYGSQNEKERDLNTCNKAMKAQLDERQILLENLQLEINKELNIISQLQRGNTLIKTA